MSEHASVMIDNGFRIRRPPGPDGGNPVVVVECDGELDLFWRPVLQATLAAAAGLGPGRVVVDVSGVTFFDCSAIGAFVEARGALQATGSTFALVGLSPFGRRVLGYVGLADLAAVASPVASAPMPGGPRRGDRGDGPPVSDRRVAPSPRGDRPASERSRYAVEQAKGVVAQHFGTTIDRALLVVGAYAQDHHSPLDAVAHGLVTGTLPADDLADHVGTAGAPDRVGAAGKPHDGP